MKQALLSPLFWFAFLIGSALMFVLNLWQLGWGGFLRYSSSWHEIAWLTPDMLLAGTIALLTGLNLAGVAHLIHQGAAEQAGRTGTFGMLGALVGLGTLYCVACQVTLFTFFGTAVAASLVAPWLPWLRVASVLLLLVATYFTVRAIRNPSCKI